MATLSNILNEKVTKTKTSITKVVTNMADVIDLEEMVVDSDENEEIIPKSIEE